MGKNSTDPGKAPNPGQSKPSGGKAGSGNVPNRPDPNDNKRKA